MAKISVLDVLNHNLKLNSELSSELSGGIWTSSIPEVSYSETVRIPYARLELEESSYEWCMSKHNNGPSCIEHNRVSILVFDNLANKVNNILSKLEVELNWAILEIPPNNLDTKLIHIYPLRKFTASEFIRDSEGNQIFSGTLVLECSLWRE